MYASVTVSKTKKPRWFRKESPALKNPKIICGEIFRWGSTNEQGERINHKSVKDPYLDGEQIIRTELKPSYVLRVGESYRQDGKVKSRQKHIQTFDEWAVIDDFMDCQEYGWEHTPGRYIDPDWYEKQLKKTFPDVDPWKFWPVIEEKLKPLEDRILAEFKKTEEYQWWLKTKNLKDRLKAEKAKAKAQAEEEKRRYEEQSRQNQQQYHQQTFTDMSASSSEISLSKEEIRVIDLCYRAMAVQLHPDKGGDIEDMQILNGLKDKIRKAV